MPWFSAARGLAVAFQVGDELFSRSPASDLGRSQFLPLNDQPAVGVAHNEHPARADGKVLRAVDPNDFQEDRSHRGRIDGSIVVFRASTEGMLHQIVEGSDVSRRAASQGALSGSKVRGGGEFSFQVEHVGHRANEHSVRLLDGHQDALHVNRAGTHVAEEAACLQSISGAARDEQGRPDLSPIAADEHLKIDQPHEQGSDTGDGCEQLLMPCDPLQ